MNIVRVFLMAILILGGSLSCSKSSDSAPAASTDYGDLPSQISTDAF